MRAIELAVSYPTVARETPALEAARPLAGHDLPGLVVIDAPGTPAVVLPGIKVLRLAVPAFCQDDPTLPGSSTRRSPASSTRHPVREPISEHPPELPVVSGHAPNLEAAAVAGGTAELNGVVTLHQLLDQMLRVDA